MENNNAKDPEALSLEHAKDPTFEEALAQTKFGLFNYLLIAVSGTILTAVLLETLGISYVVAVAECDLDLSTQQKGVLGAVAFAGVIISSHLWGFLADTRGRRRVIVPTLFAAFASTVASSLMTNFWAMAACRFMTGFFISGSSATIFAYLGEYHTSQYGSRSIMGASAVFGLGGLLLPGVAFVVINQTWQVTIPFVEIVYRPWRLFLVVCGLPSLFSAIALLGVPESPKFVFSQGNSKEAIETIKWMHRMNVGKKEAPLEIQRIVASSDEGQLSTESNSMWEQIWQQTAPLFRGSYLKRTTIVCILQFGSSLAAQGMYMFFPGILNQMAQAQDAGIHRTTVCQVVYAHRNSTEQSDYQQNCSQTLDLSTYGYSFILEAIYTVGFALIGVIINIVGRLSILVFVFTCCAVAGLLVIFVNIPLLAIWFYLILLLCGFCTNVVGAITVDLYPTNLRAMAVCISMMVGRLGSVVGANLLGFLLDSQCELTFAIPGTFLLVCGMLSFFIPGITAGRRPKEEEKVEATTNE
ncbi:synaptic vesicle glycoprotein 2B [Culex quinquefasciatus]|uniref:synaptic vesicle glycoprotein 2B n=1 Tax=Culex quinquefasciatus TaxID=7176 RepID=UPI0018E31FEA|nr:synaptic vesicle glycoprotein 2B [Culex quinquefasciatus]XP_038112015.1 synaptic vesicle glycoprotein 2B [Culex quinquefasciatus]XP_038112023.1 synaptic vesicle glycoprotein 2B [Culex quinquefasciatus]